MTLKWVQDYWYDLTFGIDKWVIRTGPLVIWEMVVGFAEDYGWGKTILGILIFLALAASYSGGGGENLIR